MEELKVSDVIPSIKEKLIIDVNTSLKKMNDINNRYINTDSLFDLEIIKKELNSELIYFATLFSKTKSFKGSNHTYFEREIKEIKALAITKIMAEDNLKVSTAEAVVYNSNYYNKRIEIIKKLIPIFIKVEEMYERYNSLLTCIIQSISVQSKDFSNNSSMGGN